MQDSVVVPDLGEWRRTADEKPPTGVWVLGYWGQVDMETCCREQNPLDDDEWWETRGGDTAAPACWRPINNLGDL
jgi:hypothetical protein